MGIIRKKNFRIYAASLVDSLSYIKIVARANIAPTNIKSNLIVFPARPGFSNK